MKTNVLPSLTLLFVVALLSGCGGSDTKIVEREPVPIDDDHDHDDEVTTQGRLLISIKDQAKVSVVDLNEKSVLHEMAVSEAPSALYSSPNNRYGFIIQRTADRVDVIDGGLWQEDHGDHLHDYEQAPKQMLFSTNKTRPTHFTGTDKQSVIFFDGNGETATPASVGVFTETDITNNTAGTVLEYSTHMHGAAQGRGDYLISTVRDATTTSTLPDRVAVYRAHNGYFVDETIFNETCPGLHGSAQNENQIAFGCTDGILVITQTGTTFTAKKIANPAIFTGTTRIGTVISDNSVDEFIGIAAGQFYAINTSTNTITPVNWIDASITPAPTASSYGFADDGALFVILDNQGKLTILKSDDWSLKARVQTITSDITALPTGSKFELALTPGHFAYVSDPIANQIKQIHLDEAKVSTTIQLDFVPNKLTWLGIAEPTAGEHSH
ncbi:5-methyltetrahydrofolate--homocysteine methyltransferase [Cellvibrio sp.]